jgi:hypothetical protein
MRYIFIVLFSLSLVGCASVDTDLEQAKHDDCIKMMQVVSNMHECSLFEE